MPLRLPALCSVDGVDRPLMCCLRADHVGEATANLGLRSLPVSQHAMGRVGAFRASTWLGVCERLGGVVPRHAACSVEFGIFRGRLMEWLIRSRVWLIR